MTNNKSDQPPELSFGNVSRGLLLGGFAVFFIALALMWPIRLVHQDFAATNGAQTVPYIVNDVIFGTPCTADYRQCTSESTALFVSDFISSYSLQVIRSAYARKPFSTLCLLSPGGSVLATIDIAQWLQERRVSLCVTEAFKTDRGQIALDDLYCYSSCAYLFASASNRIGYGAAPVVGVHDMYYQMNIPLTDRTFRAESDFLGLALDFRLTRLGIPYKWVRTFSTPNSSEIYELTIEEMNELGLLTEHRLVN